MRCECIVCLHASNPSSKAIVIAWPMFAPSKRSNKPSLDKQPMTSDRKINIMEHGHRLLVLLAAHYPVISFQHERRYISSGDTSGVMI